METCYIPTMFARVLTFTFTFAVLIGGCAHDSDFSSRGVGRGIVYILPGVEGRSFSSGNIARGLVDGGVESRVRIHDWTTGSGLLGWWVHLSDIQRNRREADRLAGIIVSFQKKHPGEPVFLIGHSGGAGIVLLTVELLRESHPIEGVILLAAAIGPERNLVQSLKRIRRGMWSFYTPRDFSALIVGTTLFGTIDRKFGPGAGAVGFRFPEDLSDEGKRLYESKLTQVRYDSSMRADGNPGTHGGWTNRRFVSKRLAPIVMGRLDLSAESGRSSD